MVAGGDPATVAAVRVVMEAGGNAVDGAVAGAFTAMVAESTLTSAGGGGVMMVCPAQGEPVVFDFFTDMPAGSAEGLDFFKVTIDFGPATQDFHIGRGASAVPGNVAGLLHAQKCLGRLEAKEVLAPAIHAAGGGIAVSEQQAIFIKNLEPILTHEADARGLYSPGGKLLEAGDRLVMPGFAAFLEELAVEGSRFFYEGEVAREISEWADAGGLIQRSDLKNYRVIERRPLACEFLGHQILLNPPPATSGARVDFILSLLERAGGARAGVLKTVDLVCAMEMADQVRPENHSQLTDAEWEEWLEIFRQRTPRTAGMAEPRATGSTTHLSVLDKEGNAVSVTTTNGEGCGHVLPNSGFMMNNMLGEEDLSPGGFHQHPPGARLPTMMAPTIVLREGRPVLVTGSGGSNRIRSAIVQVLVNVLCRRLPLEEAILSPRAHCDGGTIHAEEGFVLEELADRRLNQWLGRSLFFGGAHSVTPETAVGDPRRSGCALVFD